MVTASSVKEPPNTNLVFSTKPCQQRTEGGVGLQFIPLPALSISVNVYEVALIGKHDEIV